MAVMFVYPWFNGWIELAALKLQAAGAVAGTHGMFVITSTSPADPIQSLATQFHIVLPPTRRYRPAVVLLFHWRIASSCHEMSM